MSLYLRGAVYHYDFIHKGIRYQASTHESDRLLAEIIEQNAKRGLGKNPVAGPGVAESCEPGVYFLQSPSTKFVKVGCAGNMTQRIASYSTHNAEQLKLLAKIPAVDYQQAEKEMHAFLAPFHERGEWFRINGRHIEAAIGYWITGHKDFGANKKILGKIEPDSTLDSPPTSPDTPKVDRYGFLADGELSS